MGRSKMRKEKVAKEGRDGRRLGKTDMLGIELGVTRGRSHEKGGK